MKSRRTKLKKIKSPQAALNKLHFRLYMETVLI